MPNCVVSCFSGFADCKSSIIFLKKNAPKKERFELYIKRGFIVASFLLRYS